MSQHPSAWGRLLWIGVASVVAVASIGGACSSRQSARPQAPLPIPVLCSLPIPHQNAGAVPSLRFEQWSRLLLRDYTPGFAAANARDCTGQPVEWREFRGSCSEYCDDPTNAHRPEGERCRAPMSDAIPQRAISDDDVVVTRLGGALRLVWVMTDRFTNGEAVGPVALVEFESDRAVVRAVGTVRNYPKRVRMHLVTVGERRVLQHEGEICPDEGDASTCRRASRLLLLRPASDGGARFLQEPLRSRLGRCLGPARFEYTKDATVTLPSGWHRQFQLTTAVQVRDDGVQVHESVLVQDSDPTRPLVPPRVFRRAGQDRAVYVAGNTFVASDPSLWSRVVAVEAAVGFVRDGGVPRDASGDASDADVPDVGEDYRGDYIDGGL